MPRIDERTPERCEEIAHANGAAAQLFQVSSSTGEGELLRELTEALRTIRYGSIILTLHDGRVVEIQKTERIRRNGK
jgi:hypothetical protein